MTEASQPNSWPRASVWGLSSQLAAQLHPQESERPKRRSAGPSAQVPQGHRKGKRTLETTNEQTGSGRGARHEPGHGGVKRGIRSQDSPNPPGRGGNPPRTAIDNPRGGQVVRLLSRNERSWHRANACASKQARHGIGDTRQDR